MKSSRMRHIWIATFLALGGLMVLLAAALNDDDWPLWIVITIGAMSLCLFVAAAVLDDLEEKEQEKFRQQSLRRSREI